MYIRDRIKELRRVEAGQLAPNPKNWRTHSETQKNVLRGMLAEVGFADALLARELPDGRLMLIDGHLRAETASDQKIPVLVLDVTEAEADKLLATLDPMTVMAGKNTPLFSELVSMVQTENHAVQRMLDAVMESTSENLSAVLSEIRPMNPFPDEGDETFGNASDFTGNSSHPTSDSESTSGELPSGHDSREINIPELFQVVVECDDENHQRQTYEKLTAEGFSCRLLNL